MSVNSLGSDINTPLQLIQSECTLKPSDEASSHHLAAQHVSDSLKLCNLLKRSSFELRSVYLSFGLEFVDQVLVFVEMILRYPQ